MFIKLMHKCRIIKAESVFLELDDEEVIQSGL